MYYAGRENDNGGGYACVEAGGIDAKSLNLPFNFALNFELLSKNKVLI